MSQLSTGASDSEKPHASTGGKPPRGPPTSGGSKTIDEFCDDNRISRSFYYKMRFAGVGPVEMRFGTIVRITARAEADWQARGERELQATVAPKTASAGGSV
jgi:hypothetical protein